MKNKSVAQCSLTGCNIRNKCNTSYKNIAKACFPYRRNKSCAGFSSDGAWSWAKLNTWFGCFNWSSVNTPTATLHYFPPDIPACLLGRTTQRVMSLTLTWDRPLFRLLHRCMASGGGLILSDQSPSLVSFSLLVCCLISLQPAVITLLFICMLSELC